MTEADVTRQAVRAADLQLSSKGRSFHWARRLLGPRPAERATRLYGICRHLDDFADEGYPPHLARNKLRMAECDIKRGDSQDPVIRDGILLMNECGIAPSALLELVQGLASDLDVVRINSLDSLLRYCYRVAGTVGIMMCGVLDARKSRAFAHAIDLGIGMQITNICRDIAEDAGVGRRYLPSEMIGDIDPKDLICPDVMLRPRVQECVANLLKVADAYYRSGEAGLGYLPFRARFSILVAARLYHGIGTQLRKRQYDYWSGRAFVSPRQKIRITISALASSIVTPRVWLANEAHDPRMHEALGGLPFIGQYNAE